MGLQLEHSTATFAQTGRDTELRRVGVLIVDDDPDARDLLGALIEKAGYTVQTASNGQEALELLHVVRPELIVLDVCMPIMDGHRFREEQRHHKEWLSIPTIVMTGVDDEPMLDLAVVSTLRKPLKSRELLAIIANYCTRA